MIQRTRFSDEAHVSNPSMSKEVVQLWPSAEGTYPRKLPCKSTKLRKLCLPRPQELQPLQPNRSSTSEYITMAGPARALNFVYRMAVPVAGVSILAGQALYDVKGGTRAVIFDRLSGVRETVIGEGTHFLVPWLQRSIIFDVRTKPRNIATTTGSKDLQMVSLTLRVLHRPNVQALPKIYQVRTKDIS